MTYGFCVRPVTSYSGTVQRDLPKTYEEAREAFELSDKRRGKARGKLGNVGNTTIHKREAQSGEWKGTVAFAVRLHHTDVVTFNCDGSITLDSGGYQTFTTRDRMNRCGVRISMSDGVPSVNGEPYADGMTIHPDRAPGYNGNRPVGTAEEIRSRRRRHLARIRRTGTGEAWYWEARSGGYSVHAGTVPEAFAPDSDFGLKPRKQ